MKIKTIAINLLTARVNYIKIKRSHFWPHGLAWFRTITMKILEKNKAIELRKQGLTLDEILKEVSASKASLSYWLKDIKLTDKQLARIKYKNDKIKDKFIKFNELKKKQSDENKAAIFNNAIDEIDTLSDKELKLIGIALYWAEGHKGLSWDTVSFTNSDPIMIKLIMKWFRVICMVAEDKFRIRIQCHGTENADNCKKYWSEITGVPMRQFTKPYIKISPSSKKKVGNLCPNGVCHIRISDTSLLTKIKGWIEGLSGAIV